MTDGEGGAGNEKLAESRRVLGSKPRERSLPVPATNVNYLNGRHLRQPFVFWPERKKPKN